MKRKTLTGQILMLSMMSFISPSKANENLKCYTNYLHHITCAWNTSSVEARFHITPKTNCYLKGQFITLYTEHSQSNLEAFGSLQPKIRKGTLTFKKSLGKVFLYLSLHVWCENMTEPVETIEDFHPSDKIKLNPPEKPLVNGENVTWKHGIPQDSIIKHVKYEVQYSLLKNSWENKVVHTDEEHYELPKDELILGKQYMVRVRSFPTIYSAFWSEWSTVTQWTSTVGLQPSTEKPNDEILGQFNNLSAILVLTMIAVILVAFFCILQYKRDMKYIPTPGKYFGNLFSDHDGDFKSWLGPIMHPEMYIKADSECVSPVTIYRMYNSDLLYNKMETEANLRNGSTSGFSNSTYFLSQSSKCAVMEDQLEPCMADCPYGPAGGGSMQEKRLTSTHDNSHDSELNEVNMSTPLETSSSYKQLQKLRLDIQSPDSGFAGSSEEQESQEESGSEGLPSPPVVDSILPISCILPCPGPQLMGLPHLGFPSGLAWSPWNTQTLTNLPPDISRSVLLGNSGIMACSGILEPSSDDYMPVKKVEG